MHYGFTNTATTTKNAYGVDNNEYKLELNKKPSVHTPCFSFYKRLINFSFRISIFLAANDHYTPLNEKSF